MVDGEVTSIAQQFRRRARVPGFRPGKAPLGVVKNRYRDDILSEVFQSLLPKYFSDAAREQDLDVVHAPSYEDVDYDNGEALSFKAVFEVYPRLDVTNHTGIPVEEIPTEVSDAEIDQALERMLEEHAEMTPVEEDREIKDGDFVEISFTGSIEDAGDDAPDLSAEKALCEIGGETTLREFTKNLTGLKAGEEATFDVVYKDDHPDKNLAGKNAHFTVEVDSIKEKHRPELDDDFAQSLGDFDKLDDLKANVRENLEQHRRHHADEQTHEAILGWLEDNNEFEVPDSLVEQQLQTRLQRMMRELSQQGVNPQGLDVELGQDTGRSVRTGGPGRAGFTDSRTSGRTREDRGRGRRNRTRDRSDRCTDGPTQGKCPGDPDQERRVGSYQGPDSQQEGAWDGPGAGELRPCGEACPKRRHRRNNRHRRPARKSHLQSYLDFLADEVCCFWATVCNRIYR